MRNMPTSNSACHLSILLQPSVCNIRATKNSNCLVWARGNVVICNSNAPSRCVGTKTWPRIVHYLSIEFKWVKETPRNFMHQPDRCTLCRVGLTRSYTRIRISLVPPCSVLTSLLTNKRQLASYLHPIQRLACTSRNTTKVIHRLKSYHRLIWTIFCWP